LADTAEADAEESDELEELPEEMKTAHGYLKDSFVVDDNQSSSEGSPDNASPEAELTTDEEVTDSEYDSNCNESELDLEDYESESEVEVDQFVE
jgi:hypothetical protein